jgi:hypothetical protein
LTTQNNLESTPPRHQSQSLVDQQQTSKMSTCTMTGKSLNNLEECLSTTSSEDKGVQTIFHDSIRNHSSTSLSSSSSTSIQTDSLENKPKIDQISKYSCQLVSDDKWPHLLPGEQTCIYWVNYLGKKKKTFAD